MQKLDIINYLSCLCSFERNEELAKLHLTDKEIDAIASVAIGQRVSAWCLSRIHKDYSDNQMMLNLGKKLLAETINSLVRNKKNIAILQQIERLLYAKGIEVVALKGIAMMTSHYADISLRSIGDIDLWVDPKDVRRAKEILLANGGKASTHVSPPMIEDIRAHLDSFGFMQQSIELHQRLYSKADRLNPIKPISDYVVECNKHLILNDAAMGYHLATHLAKTMVTDVIRLSWIVDIALLIEKAESPIDYINQIIEINPASKRSVLKPISLALSMLPMNTQCEIAKEFGIKPKKIDNKLTVK